MVGDRPSAGPVRGNPGDDAVRGQTRPEGIGVEDLVGDHDLDGQPSKQRFGRRHFVALAGARRMRSGLLSVTKSPVLSRFRDRITFSYVFLHPSQTLVTRLA